MFDENRPVITICLGRGIQPCRVREHLDAVEQSVREKHGLYAVLERNTDYMVPSITLVPEFCRLSVKPA